MKFNFLSRSIKVRDPRYSASCASQIRADWLVAIANIRVVAHADQGGDKVRAAVNAAWDAILGDCRKYGLDISGPAFSDDVEQMLSGTGYNYTRRDFSVFKLADVIEIRHARLDGISGNRCVRFVIGAQAYDGPFATAEILRRIDNCGRFISRDDGDDAWVKEIASLADKLDACAHEVTVTVLDKLVGIVARLRSSGDLGEHRRKVQRHPGKFAGAQGRPSRGQQHHALHSGGV